MDFANMTFGKTFMPFVSGTMLFIPVARLVKDFLHKNGGEYGSKASKSGINFIFHRAYRDSCCQAGEFIPSAFDQEADGI